MKVGDIVEMVDVSHPSLDLLGIVIEIDVNMWGEEVTPSGVSVLWADGEMDTVYGDEISLAKLMHAK